MDTTAAGTAPSIGWTIIYPREVQMKANEAVKPLPVLTLTRRFNAPRDLVFRAWLDAKHLAEWWGPKGFTNPVCMVNTRPGGSIRIDMVGPDGAVYPMRGRYIEIDEPERLVFTTEALDDDGVAMFEIFNTVLFSEHGEGTEIMLEARVRRAGSGTERYLRGMSQGWNESLDRLVVLIARLPKAVAAD
jgi:uncharacterized protein YndB with AHSA1/START domain